MKGSSGRDKVLLLFKMVSQCWVILVLSLIFKGDSYNFIDNRTLGPKCLDNFMTWQGKENNRSLNETGIGAMVDKIYVIHYTRAEERKLKMIETLASIGVDANSSLVDFVEAYDREEIPDGLGDCVNCGEHTISPAVCSVNLKHIAAYRDAVKQNHQLVMILEDDIALSGAEFVNEHDGKFGAQNITDRNFVAGMREVLSETMKFNKHHLANNNNILNPTSNTTIHINQSTLNHQPPLLELLVQPHQNHEIEYNFDSMIFGKCVFSAFADRIPFISKETAHLFRAGMKIGASKCMGAVLLTNRGANRLLKGLPYPNKDVLYKGMDGKCYKSVGGFPDHHLNMVHRMTGNDFIGLWVIPELASEMKMEEGKAHIWRSTVPPTKKRGTPKKKKKKGVIEVCDLPWSADGSPKPSPAS